MGASARMLRGLVVISAILATAIFGLYRITSARPGSSVPITRGSEAGRDIPVYDSAVVFVPATETFEEARDTFTHSVRFENRLGSAITVRDVKTSCACAVVKPLRATYCSGEGGSIPVQIDLHGKPRGARRYSLSLEYQDADGQLGEARTELVIDHKPDVVVSPPSIHIQLTPGERKVAQVMVMDYRLPPRQLGEAVASSPAITDRCANKVKFC